jgi:PAS domain S-box-containing protein
MNESLVIVLVVQMASVAGLVALVWYSQRFRSRPETKWFLGLLTVCLGWAFCYGMELALADQAWKTAMLELRFLFVPYAGFFALGLVIQICGRSEWLKPWRIGALLVIPLLSTVLALLIPFTGLFKVIVGIDASGTIPILVSTNGPWYWIMNLNNVVLILVSCFLLARHSLSQRKTFRMQYLLLIGALILPECIDLAFQAGMTPIKGYSPTSASFAITNVLVAWSIYRYGMLDLKPFARNLVIDNMADMMIVEDSNGRIVDLNRSAVTFIGMEEKDIIGKEIADILPGLGQESAEYAEGPVLLRNSNGERHFDHNRMRLNGADHAGVVHLLHDMTERIRTERLLQESERISRELLEGAPFSVVIVDLEEGKASFANRRAAELFNISLEDLGGYSLPEFYSNIDDRLKLYAQVQQRGPVQDMEVRMRDANGKEFWALMSARLVEFNRRPSLFVAVNDISERKMASQALGRVNEKLKLMSSITRHDLTNNLMGITGYIEMARKETELAKRERLIEKALALGERSHHLLQFARDYEQIGAEAPLWQDVAGVVNIAVEQLEIAGVRIECRLDRLKIFADGMLVKVFYNLLENSLRHGGKVDRIEIGAEIHEGNAVIFIQDNGRGIPLENKERIFEKGFGSNTGLGLFLVRQVLGITGIVIKENGKEGGGARFEITIPNGTFRQGD